MHIRESLLLESFLPPAGYKKELAVFLYEVLKYSDCDGKNIVVDWMPKLLLGNIPTDIEGYTGFLEQNVNTANSLKGHVNNDILKQLLDDLSETANALIKDLKSGDAGENEIQTNISEIFGKIETALGKLEESNNS